MVETMLNGAVAAGMAEAEPLDSDALVALAWRRVTDWVSYRDQKLDIRRARWYYRCFGGLYFPDQDQTDEVRAFINDFFSEVQLRIAVNNRQRPSVTFEAPQEEDDEQSKALLDRVQGDFDQAWTVSGMDYLRLLATKDAYLMSTGIIKILGGPGLTIGSINEFGHQVQVKGKVSFDIVNPMEFVVAPGATELEQAYGCAHVCNLHISEAKRIAGEWARAPGNKIQPDPDKIRPGIMSQFQDLEDLKKAQAGFSPVVHSDGTNPTRIYYDTQPKGTGYGSNDLCTVAEVYLRGDDASIELTVIAGGELLYFGPAPIPSRFPFARYCPLPDTTSFWGALFCRVWESLVDWKAKVLSMYLEGFIGEATTLAVADAQADVDYQAAYGGRGVNLLTGVTLGSPLRIEHTGKVPAGSDALLGHLTKLLKDVTGQTDALRGFNPPGVTSGDQLNMLLDTATTFISPEIECMQHGDEQIARIWAEAAGYGEIVSHVRVEPGSSAGFRRMKEAQVVMTLLQNAPWFFGSPDLAREEIAKRLNYPDREAFLRKVQQAQEQQQQAQPMGAMPGAPAGMPTSATRAALGAVSGGPAAAGPQLGGAGPSARAPMTGRNF